MVNQEPKIIWLPITPWLPAGSHTKTFAFRVEGGSASLECRLCCNGCFKRLPTYVVISQSIVFISIFNYFNFYSFSYLWHTLWIITLCVSIPIQDRNMHTQSILYVVKKHEFKKGIRAVYVLFPWPSPINVISLKSQRPESYGSRLWCLRQSQKSNNSWETDLWIDLRFYTMKFFISSELWRFPRCHHDHRLNLSHFTPYRILHFGQITGKVLKWIFDRSILDHRNVVIFLQMLLLDWIYYQSFTSNIV